MAIGLGVHGGAWNLPDADVEAHLRGIAAALRPGWLKLRDGAPALDVVEQAVRSLEKDPSFNAGCGARLTQSGCVQLDASIMDGMDLAAGAVAAVERIRHPVTLARRIMEASPHVFLVAEGAEDFARSQGIERCRTRDLLVGRERQRYLAIRAGNQSLIDQEFALESDVDEMGTVGAVARDQDGHVAAATSTGGTQDKADGRVGDSAVIGAGTYADDEAGAVSCTGWGEGILRLTLGRWVIDRLLAGDDPAPVGSSALESLRRLDAHAGLILVDRHGCVHAVFNTPRMARGIATEADGLQVGVDAEMIALKNEC